MMKVCLGCHRDCQYSGCLQHVRLLFVCLYICYMLCTLSLTLGCVASKISLCRKSPALQVALVMQEQFLLTYWRLPCSYIHDVSHYELPKVKSFVQTCLVSWKLNEESCLASLRFLYATEKYRELLRLGVIEKTNYVLDEVIDHSSASTFLSTGSQQQQLLMTLDYPTCSLKV